MYGRTERYLLLGKIVDATGSGMYVPFMLVFLRRVTGLPLGTVGAVLGVAGLVGMFALPLAGAAVDRFGARRAQLAGYVVRGAVFAAYPFAHTLAAFAVLATVAAVAARAFPAVQQAVIAELVTGPNRDRFNALSRSINNAGLGAGGLLASLLLTVAGTGGLVIAAWLNAASFLIAGALNATLGLPGRVAADPATPATRGGYRTVLADRPFLLLTVANFLISFGYAALSVLLPIYAVLVLHAPASIAGLLFAVNTALCAAGGVPVAALSRRFGRRTRVAGAGAVVFALSFLAYALLGTGGPLAVVELVAVTVLYTIGELVHSPAATTLAQAAAPDALRGRYLAAYQMSWSLSAALAPAAFTALLGVGGRLPWLALAATVLAGAYLLVVAESRLPRAVVGDDRPAASSADRRPVQAATA